MKQTVVYSKGPNKKQAAAIAKFERLYCKHGEQERRERAAESVS